MPPAAAAMSTEQQPGVAHVGRIPVRNLWLLMLYASHLFRELEKAKVAVEENPDDIPDLVAEMLCRRVERRVQRNLSHGYQPRHAVLNRVRGRIDLLYTERHRLLERGKVACRFDELTVDTARNRYVRNALEEVSRIVHRSTLAHRCRSLALSLRRMGVTGAPPQRSDIAIDRFGRHDAEDQPMVAAARLAMNLALPTQHSGTRLLSEPGRDLTWIYALYEKGIAGFYETVLPRHEWRVHAGKILRWQPEQQSAGIAAILPTMKTDIVIDHLPAARRTVIDTKFNTLVTRGWHRSETLRSGYLFQIYAYLRSQECMGDALADTASGVLLHPAVGEWVQESMVIQNHEIRFCTVDLAAPARDIRKQLLHAVSAHLSD